MKKTAVSKTSRFLNVLRAVLALVVIGSCLFGARSCGLWGGERPARFEVYLAKTIDGDTIRVTYRGEEIKVRLMGIDTPELGTAASFRSALFCAELLEDAKKIELEPDPKRPKDKYQRTLGWVWVTPRKGMTILLQEELIREGLADLYRDSKGSKYYNRLERAAR